MALLRMMLIKIKADPTVMVLSVILMMKFEGLVLVIIIRVMDTGNSDIGIGVCAGNGCR